MKGENFKVYFRNDLRGDKMILPMLAFLLDIHGCTDYKVH